MLWFLGRHQGDEIHVHGIGQEVGIARIDGHRADEHRLGPLTGSLALGDEIRIGRHFDVGQETVEPVVAPGDLAQHLHTLAAARDEPIGVSFVELYRMAELPEIVKALRVLGDGPPIAHHGQEHARPGCRSRRSRREARPT